MMDDGRKEGEYLEAGSLFEHFWDEVSDQIAYKPIRPSIRQELEEHLLDRVEVWSAFVYRLVVCCISVSFR